MTRIKTEQELAEKAEGTKSHGGKTLQATLRRAAAEKAAGQSRWGFTGKIFPSDLVEFTRVHLSLLEFRVEPG